MDLENDSINQSIFTIQKLNNIWRTNSNPLCYNKIFRSFDADNH